MKNLFKVVMCLVALSPLSAKAANCCYDPCCFDDYYISVSGGGNWGFNHKPDQDTGWFVGAAIGTDLDCDMRAEISYDYLRNEYDSHGDKKEQIHAALFNVYRDFCEVCCLTPYAGAGIGYAYVNSDHLDNHNNHQFGFQFGGGLRYDIDCCMSVSASYRLFGHTRGNGTGYHHLFGLTLSNNY